MPAIIENGFGGCKIPQPVVRFYNLSQLSINRYCQSAVDTFTGTLSFASLRLTLPIMAFIFLVSCHESNSMTLNASFPSRQASFADKIALMIVCSCLDMRHIHSLFSLFRYTKYPFSETVMQGAADIADSFSFADSGELPRRRKEYVRSKMSSLTLCMLCSRTRRDTVITL